MQRFPLLLDHADYFPAVWDLRRDRVARAYWRDVFKQQFRDMLKLLEEEGDAPRLAAAEAASHELFAQLDADPWPEAMPHVHALCLLRSRLLARHGVGDPYLGLKRRDNAVAAGLLGGLLRRLERAPDTRARLRLAASWLFAGNVYDAGSPAAARQRPGDSFQEIAERLAAADWLVDDSSALAGTLERLGRGAARALILVDNAGFDFVCGIVPWAMVLVRAGLRVQLAANEGPALNDITCAEARELLADLAVEHASIADALAERALSVISSGLSAPGIDLASVGRELCDAAPGIELLILEGQGRALETNWHSRLAVETLRVATIKDRLLAEALGGRMFDPILELRAAGARRSANVVSQLRT